MMILIYYLHLNVKWEMKSFETVHAAEPKDQLDLFQLHPQAQL